MALRSCCSVLKSMGQREGNLALSGRQAALLSLGDSLARKGELSGALKVYSELYSEGEVDKSLLGHLVSALVKFQMEKIAEERAQEKTRDDDQEFGEKEKFFICGLCSGIFVDPVTLSCGHTFCRLCIEEKLTENCKKCGLENSEECKSMNILLCNVIAKWFPSSYELGSKKSHAWKIMRDGNFDEAVAEFSEILRSCPRDLNCRCWRADCFLSLGYPEIALKDIEVACSLGPNLAHVFHRKAKILLRLEKLEQVVLVMLRSCAIEPRSEKLRSELKDALHNLFKLDISAFTDTLATPLLTSNFTKFCRNEYEDPSVAVKNSSVVTDYTCVEDQSDDADDVFHFCDQDDSTNVPNRKKRELLSSSSGLDPSPKSPRPVNPEVKRPRRNSPEDMNTLQTLDSAGDNIIVNGSSTEQVDDFECKLCYNLIFEPVTSSCGHSFCKECLYRSLDHRVECPCCRTALTKFLAERRQAVTNVLDRITKELFPEEYQKRKNLYYSEMEELRRASEWSGHELPIFVCTLALPFVQCPLHIFEPRYRLMIRRCIKSGSRLFGMCTQGEDPSKPLSTYGTLLKIKDVKYLQDGRSVISTVGTRRFCVQSYSMKDGYYVAKVKWVVDDSEEDADEIMEIQRRHTSGFAMLQLWFNGLSEEQKNCVIDAIGPMPNCEEEVSRIGNDGPEWLWWALAALPLQDKPKLIILAMTSVVERLRSIQRFLMLMIKMQQRSSKECK